MKKDHKDKNSKKEKAIWFFAGGGMHEAAVKNILERGYKLILTDMNPKCLCAKYADEFILLDTFDIKGNLAAAKEMKNKYDIRAVVTVASDCHETVACVSRYLGLPGISPELAHVCRYKPEMRDVLEKAGIPQPKFKRVKNLQEAKAALKAIGLPAALKATNNSGSRGFSEIKTAKDLTQEKLNEAIKNGTTGYAIIETLLLPIENEIAEQSVETLWYDGKMYWLNWVDRIFRKDFLKFKNLEKIGKKMYSTIGWGVEIGHINPAIHNLETKEAVREMIYKAGLAIGMGKQKGGHILKADIILTQKGPYILELTPRLSGGWDSSRTTILRGANFIEGAISLALGEDLNLELWRKYFQYYNPNLFASVLTEIEMDAKDCIGRKFAVGTDFDIEKSLEKAYEALVKKDYL